MRILLLTLLLVATPTLAKSPSLKITSDSEKEAQDPPLTIGIRDDGRTVTLDKDTILEVNLTANARKDQRWSITTVPSQLKKAGQLSYADDDSGVRFQTFHFGAKPRAKGRGILTFKREGGAAKTVRYTIVVR